jgi:ADP-ribose pyrophosphatase YjhB (NUDIX family)
MLSRIIALPKDEIVTRWNRDFGYVTPKIGVAGAVFDDSERLLLLQRPDNRLWTLPVGWAEVGETAAAGVLREVQEETSLTVRPQRLLGIYDARVHGSGNPHHFYNLVFECSREAGSPSKTAEALDVGYYSPDQLPPLVAHLERAVADAFAARKPNWPGPAFDR